MRRIISMSEATFEPTVVSMSPTIRAFMPLLNAFSTMSDIMRRPPAKRMNASGFMKRNTAIVRRTSSRLIGAAFSNLVPFIGLSMLTGMDFTPCLRSSSAISMRSSAVSPMPMMPPEHIFKTCLTGVSHRAQFFIVRVFGDKRRKKTPRCFKIYMVMCYSGFFQHFHSGQIQKPHRCAERYAAFSFLSYSAINIACFLHSRYGKCPRCSNHGKTVYTVVFICKCGADGFLFVYYIVPCPHLWYGIRTGNTRRNLRCIYRSAH